MVGECIRAHALESAYSTANVRDDGSANGCNENNPSRKRSGCHLNVSDGEESR